MVWCIFTYVKTKLCVADYAAGSQGWIASLNNRIPISEAVTVLITNYLAGNNVVKIRSEEVQMKHGAHAHGFRLGGDYELYLPPKWLPIGSATKETPDGNRFFVDLTIAADNLTDEQVNEW